MFIYNAWYVAAFAADVAPGKTLGRKYLNKPVVLFRTGAGAVAALEDRCPHRLAPLSMGECADGGLRCGYHGMLFDGSGACLSIPGQSVIPPTATVRAYPVIERYGLVWLWTGGGAC